MTKFLAVNIRIHKREKFPRAALVTSMQGLKDAICVPVDEAIDLNALVCLHSVEGVSGQQWARRWLFGGGSSASKKLTTYMVGYSRHESNITIYDVKCELAKACDPRKLGLGAKQRRLTNIL